MNSNGSGGKLEEFFTGKGFYIVLFLCAAVIGVSAWMMAAGNKTMENAEKAEVSNFDNKRVETVILPPEKESVKPEKEAVAAEEEEAPVPVWNEEQTEELVNAYVWPVRGELERWHDVENLSYDVTMRDWRTHEGIDICAPMGTEVVASHSGVVESITEDDLYGTVVTVAHGDGSCSVYANLAALPAVSVGDAVECGYIIGSVGDTALCEIGQGTHLHYAVYIDGESVDPLDYLPA